MGKYNSARQLSSFPLTRLVSSLIGVFVGVGIASSASAFVFDTENTDIKMSWDNTLKYSAATRLKNPNESVASSTNMGPQLNTNDGDLNFKKNALTSNRLDWLTEFDMRYKNDFGLRVSGAAWYEDVYNHGTDNSGVGYVNTVSTPSNRFSSALRKQNQNGEIKDAFVYGNFNTGESNINVKAGQYTQLYGETLYFGYNGIAAAQTPLDLARALAVPSSQFKEVAMPVKQLSTQVQINPWISAGAYYQVEWKKNRLPAAGGYFSFADFADVGGETIFLGPDMNNDFGPGGSGRLLTVHRGQDLAAKNSGQGGMQVKFKLADTELGLYAAQFHDKMPQFYARPGNHFTGPIGSGPFFDAGDYALVYGENIKTWGASLSTVLGETNVSGELSFRNNMPLVANGITVITGAASDGGSNPAYPVGNSLHFNTSAISVLSANRFWDGASFVGELAYNKRLSISKNAGQLDPSATQGAAGLQFVFQPEYFQVAPGLDVQVPIGLAYGIHGKSSVAGVSSLMPSLHGGNMTIGVKGDYQKTWQSSLNYTHYYGPKGSVILYNAKVPELSYQNFLGDRDFLSVTLQRTF